VAKLVDAPSSGGGAARCAGSNPVLGTIKKTPFFGVFLIYVILIAVNTCKLLIISLAIRIPALELFKAINNFFALITRI
jgi:hypothetical protein